MTDLVALFDQLEDALSDERAAVRALDHEAVREAASTKQQIVDEISRAAASWFGADDAPGLRSVVRGRAERAHRMSWANAALLADALACVRDALGLDGRPSGYDRRGRVR